MTVLADVQEALNNTGANAPIPDHFDPAQ